VLPLLALEAPPALPFACEPVGVIVVVLVLPEATVLPLALTAVPPLLAWAPELVGVIVVVAVLVLPLPLLTDVPPLLEAALLVPDAVAVGFLVTVGVTFVVVVLVLPEPVLELPLLAFGLLAPVDVVVGLIVGLIVELAFALTPEPLLWPPDKPVPPRVPCWEELLPLPWAALPVLLLVVVWVLAAIAFWLTAAPALRARTAQVANRSCRINLVPFRVPRPCGGSREMTACAGPSPLAAAFAAVQRTLARLLADPFYSAIDMPRAALPTHRKKPFLSGAW
jgi:hypothetical protein